MTLAEARKICFDYTSTGFETISKLPPKSASEPFRFIYVSGANSERDQMKKPWVLGDYCLMRGEAESRVIDYANNSEGTVKACIAKPGLIDAPGKRGPVMQVVSTIGRTLIGLPKVEVSEIAATLLKQAVDGIEKETLLNEDLVRIGRTVLAGQ